MLARARATGADGGMWERQFRQLKAGRLDLALSLHHDAITGTSRPSVVAGVCAFAGVDNAVCVLENVSFVLTMS